MENKNTDFKYILQDLTTVYLGANYTYQDMMDEDAIPFKLKTIISQFIAKEVSMDYSISQHLTEIEEKALTYLVFRQLKIKIKIVNKIYKFEEFIVNRPQIMKQPNFIIQEIIISKLSIMSLSI